MTFPVYVSFPLRRPIVFVSSSKIAYRPLQFFTVFYGLSRDRLFTVTVHEHGYILNGLD